MIVGGLRVRLLQDSVFYFVAHGLRTIGWLDAGRRHKPVRVQSKPAVWNEPVAPNLVAVDFLSSTMSETELGSPLTDDAIVAHIEIYAENDSLGVDLSNDLRDLLRGRLTSTGSGGHLPIFDLRQGEADFSEDVLLVTQDGQLITDQLGAVITYGATPPVIGSLAVGQVSALRNVSPSADTWVRHWYRVRVEMTDTYYTSEA